jgi:hypothetical protein
MNALRSLLYRLARLLGDINAVERGPAAILRRLVRKSAYKGTARLLRRGGL